MIIPIGHENMSTRRWPVVTFALIAINVVVFFATYQNIQDNGAQLRTAKNHIILLSAVHPELKVQPDIQRFVANFRDNNKETWAQIQQPNRQAMDSWDAQMLQTSDPAILQQKMDSLSQQYEKLEAASIVARYGFTPAHPRLLSYLTANFLHGGWFHIIGNMWFLWLAGFVLEDFWGRALYAAFYLVAGAAALQFHAWLNPGSMVPAIGASGAIAALMGAFLVRFPKMKIEMGWLFAFRFRRFHAPAYCLLPLWLIMETVYGILFNQGGGIAHWAHVGGFMFGAGFALALRYSGYEDRLHKKVEEGLSWTNDPAITQASELLDHNDVEGAAAVLNPYLESHPDSVDGWSLIRQVYTKKADVAGCQHAIAMLCAAHLKARETNHAWQDYEEFLGSGGEQLPAATWLELCRVLETEQSFERAIFEYEKLAAAYPSERTSLTAQLGAARVCLKMQQPEQALKFYRAAASSPVPHLDWEQSIQAGIREATHALPRAQAASAGSA
jgi:membrane associated rhomboid family serine protease